MLKSHRQTILETLGRNPIHPFPARMAPGIALDALGDSKRTLRVLDPMSGSGTVLAVARAKGHRAIGVDIDPLSVLLASVWTRSLDAAEVNDKAAEVLSRARVKFAGLHSGRAYPAGSDEETRRFTRYWFDDYARRQLCALSASIARVNDEKLRDALWCGFSRLIITKQAGASLAMDLSHSRPHKTFMRAPVKPFNRFMSAVETVTANCPQLGARGVGPAAMVKCGDARQLDTASDSIDMVLTSPPYLNGIDYMRCSKFSLVWMGRSISELRKIRTESVGTEAALYEALDFSWVNILIGQLGFKSNASLRGRALLARYIWDMGRAIAEVARVLRRGGRAIYVIGESTSKGNFIRNSAVITAMAERHGLLLVSRYARSLPADRRYLPPPNRDRLSAKLDRRLRREVVIGFRKS
jgi:DNA modification methylase